MSSASQEEVGGRMASRSLREELASLKIERKEERRSSAPRPQHSQSESPKAPRKSGPGFFLQLLTLLLWLIPLGAVGGGSYVAYRQYQKIRSKPEVKTSIVQTMSEGEALSLLDASGYIKSRYQARIGARTPGRVEKMLVEEGTKVKEGQLLAVLEHNDMDALLESRRASILRVEADMLEGKADFREKDRKAKLQANLYSRKQVAYDIVEEASAAREMSSARLLSQEANLKLMKASMKEIEETIRNMNIFAPFDGTVVEKGAEQGETITPGGMGGGGSGRGSVVTLADLGHLDVETDIHETMVSRVSIGQPAEISVSAVPKRHYRGRLRQIIPMGDRARGTVKVKVEILDADVHLFPELESKVHFLPDQKLENPISDKSSLFVDKQAIVEENGQSHVWVVNTSGIVEKRPVEVVVTDKARARVEKGLSANETVILSPPKTLQAGDEVKVSR